MAIVSRLTNAVPPASDTKTEMKDQTRGSGGPDSFAQTLKRTQLEKSHPAAIQKPESRDPRVLKAAQMYESYFLRQMLTEMRKTVPESELMPANQGEKIFREQLDDQYVETWVDRGGIGLSDLIYDQVMEKIAGASARSARLAGPPGEKQGTPEQGSTKVKRR